jgi:ABC-2 type transport system permease protein
MMGTSVRAALRLQLSIMRAQLARAAILVAIPFYALIFFAIVRANGRPDLDSTALLAPALAGMWTLCLHLAGDIVDGDRWSGVLDAVLAAPARLFHVVLGRSAAVGLISLVAFVEAVLCALVFFQTRLPVAHPWLLVLGLLATVFASTCCCCLVAIVCVLGKHALAFKNALIYPVYVLGGVFLPVAFLPGWLGGLSRVVYLSWSSDVLRAAVSVDEPAHPWASLGAIVGLGLVSLLAAGVVAELVTRRIRATGRVLAS